MQRSREIRLEGNSAGVGKQGAILSGLVNEEDKIHQQHPPLTSFDQEEILQFGSIDCLGDLNFDLQEMQALCEGLNQEFGDEVKRAAEQGCDSSPPRPIKGMEADSAAGAAAAATATTTTTRATASAETLSHPLWNKNADSSSDSELNSYIPLDINKPESADITINDGPTSSTATTTTPSPESPLGRNPDSSSVDVSAGNTARKNRRAVLYVCGRLCFAYMACKLMQRRSRNQ